MEDWKVSNFAIFLIPMMIAFIIVADFFFFRNDFRRRLMANIVIVTIFGITYVILGRRS